MSEECYISMWLGFVWSYWVAGRIRFRKDNFNGKIRDIKTKKIELQHIGEKQKPKTRI